MSLTVTVGVACLLSVCLCLSAASPAISLDTLGLENSHNITKGHRSGSDYNLFHGVIKANTSAVQTVQVNETCYPPHSKARISYFSVLDLIPHGEGGYSEVLSGGVDHPQVCVRLTSQPHKTYYFMIDVWGTYTDTHLA